MTPSACVKRMKSMEFKGCRIAVLGMARTGFATAPVLKNLGATVTLYDSAPSETLREKLMEAERLGIVAVPNASPEDLLHDADIVVPSPGVIASSPYLQEAVKRGVPVLSEIEVAYRISVSPILAVTGTNGKTTTTMLLGEMLRTHGGRTYVAGNISADEIKLPLISAAWEAEPQDVIVAEISSFQLEWVEKFRPKIGILTNITPDHLNRHASFAEYISCKARMFAAQQEEDVAVINAINAPARSIGEGGRAQKLWFDRRVGMRDNYACVENGRIVVKWSGKEYPLCRPEESPLQGTHNLENILAASGAAIAFGADPEAINQAIRSFQGAPHRMEKVAEINHVLYINNSMCTNVDAAVRCLEALNRPPIVIAGGVSKKSDFSRFGVMISRKAKALILIGRDADEIENATRPNGFNAIFRAQSMEEAVSRASAIATEGDVVILSPACASFDMFPSFEERGEAFRNAVHRLTDRG